MDDVFPSESDARAFPLYPATPVDKASDIYRQNIADWTEVLKQYQEGLE